jgi:hypothetical protein
MENSWHRLNLGSEEVGAGRIEEIKGEFEKAFAAAQGPRTMALFRSDTRDGGAALFFTPEAGARAQELLERWDCAPCDRPSLIGLQLLVGHHEITYYLP